MQDRRIWVIDTEGNGANPSEIIELAIAEMVDLQLTGLERTWRFRPKNRVTWFATRVHGITDADLKGAPRIADCIDEIRDMIGTEAIAGHAVQVEMTALRRVMPEWQPVRAYDTLRMSKRTYPDLPRHRLSAMGDHLDLSGTAAAFAGGAPHCALYDAALSGLLMARMISECSEGDLPDMLHDAEIIGLKRDAQERQRRAKERKEMRRSLRRAANDAIRRPGEGPPTE